MKAFENQESNLNYLESKEKKIEKTYSDIIREKMTKIFASGSERGRDLLRSIQRIADTAIAEDQEMPRILKEGFEVVELCDGAIARIEQEMRDEIDACEKLKVLPQTKFKVSENFSSFQEKIINDSLHLDFDYSALSVEPKEKSIDDYDAICQATEDIFTWLKNLGLNVNQRMPLLINKIKIFSKENWGIAYREINNGASGYGSIGFLADNDDLIIKENDKEKEYGVIIHEAVHGFSVKTFDYFGDRGVGFRRSLKGWKKEIEPSVFGGFNEIMTEMITLEIINSSNRDDMKKVLQRSGDNGYMLGVIFMDEIFQKMAVETNQDVKKIANEIYLAYFNGDMSALKIFNQIMGKGAVKELSTIGANHTADHYIWIAKNYFGINTDNLKNRFDLYKECKPIYLNNGIEIMSKL